MCSAASGPAFQAALAAALEAGKQELTSLKSLADDVQSSYLLAGEPAIPGEGADDLLHEFVAMRRRFSDGLAGHLKEQADVLSAFNIVFFGRTGAGKSTLLSAFGELDGTAVSQGESDWTKNVQTIVWEGCRFYDTPGINGWGGRDSRENLEARAPRMIPSPAREDGTKSRTCSNNLARGSNSSTTNALAGRGGATAWWSHRAGCSAWRIRGPGPAATAIEEVFRLEAEHMIRPAGNVA